MIAPEELLALAAGFVWTLSESLNGFRGRTTRNLESSSGTSRHASVSTEVQTTTQRQGVVFGEIYRRQAPGAVGPTNSAPGLKALLSPGAESVGFDLREGPRGRDFDVGASSSSGPVQVGLAAGGGSSSTTAGYGLLPVRLARTEDLQEHPPASAAASSCAAVHSTGSRSDARSRRDGDESSQRDSNGGSSKVGGSCSSLSLSSSLSSNLSSSSSSEEPPAVGEGRSFELVSNPMAVPDRAYGDGVIARSKSQRHSNRPPHQLRSVSPMAAGALQAQQPISRGPTPVWRRDRARSAGSSGEGYDGGFSSSSGSSILAAAVQVRAAMSSADPGAAMTAAALALAAAVAQRCACGGAVAALRPSHALVKGFDMCRVRSNISYAQEGEEQEDDDFEEEQDEDGGEARARPRGAATGRSSGGSGRDGVSPRLGGYRTGRSQSVCEGVYKLRRLQLPITPPATHPNPGGSANTKSGLGPGAAGSALSSASATSAASTATELPSATSALQSGPDDPALPGLCGCCGKDSPRSCGCTEQRDCQRYRDQVGAGGGGAHVVGSAAAAVCCSRLEGSAEVRDGGWDSSSCGSSTAERGVVKDDPLTEPNVSPCAATGPRTPSPVIPHVAIAAPFSKPESAVCPASSIAETRADSAAAVGGAAAVSPCGLAEAEAPSPGAPGGPSLLPLAGHTEAAPGRCSTPAASPRPLPATAPDRRSVFRSPFSSHPSPPALPDTPAPPQRVPRAARRSSVALASTSAAPLVGFMAAPRLPASQGSGVRAPQTQPSARSSKSRESAVGGWLDPERRGALARPSGDTTSTPFSRGRSSTTASPLTATPTSTRRPSNASDVSTASSGGMTARSTASASVFCGGNSRYGNGTGFGRSRAVSCLSNAARPPTQRHGQPQTPFSMLKASAAAGTPSAQAAAATASLELSRRRQAREQVAAGAAAACSYLRPTMSSVAKSLGPQRSLQTDVQVPVQPATAPAPLPLQALLS